MQRIGGGFLAAISVEYSQILKTPRTSKSQGDYDYQYYAGRYPPGYLAAPAFLLGFIPSGGRHRARRDLRCARSSVVWTPGRPGSSRARRGRVGCQIPVGGRPGERQKQVGSGKERLISYVNE